MAIIEGFTRRETQELTGTSSNRLQYLERSQLVIPHRIGTSRKPTVIYTWEQVLEIRAIKNLRQEISLQTVRKIIKFLDESGFDDSLRDKQLVVIDDDVFWVQPDWTDFPEKMPSVLRVAGNKSKDVGQYVLLVIPPLSEIVNEIWTAAEKSQAVDFESFKQRAKAKPSRAA
ncbi:MerR family transcriptional regulator [Planktothrix sp. FACHB-1355]|uniref:MerR family transcriptional regulator n=1 Tax=Aerosakkonema funiforme FACHB-1375 TaxID=2949571 RepID=A0A926VCR3_9CYAN|nr:MULTISPECIES: MerR family transcriptional regulator [Oscillatoriales]MBD2180507.1 MerR family transcriptional regulator [Aerosakkonema funiforme FACHB-1375]MBD3561112.1 MerR family transcriptional regulator [Planktothrix sp. FACHB-1355]